MIKVIDRAMAGLGVTRLSRVLVALGVVAVLAAAGGIYAGLRWERGTQAIATVKERDRQLEALQQAAIELRDRGVENTADYRAAANRMDLIATQLEKDRATNRQFVEQQRGALADLLARRPDLRRLDLGADVLQHWNRSNQGALRGTGRAPAGPAGQPANVVPGSSPGNVIPDGGAAGQPQPGHRAVPRLPGHQRQPPAGDGGMAANGAELVLPGAAAHWRTGTELSTQAQGTGSAGPLTHT